MNRSLLATGSFSLMLMSPAPESDLRAIVSGLPVWERRAQDVEDPEPRYLI
jgi:hypothetical protein